MTDYEKESKLLMAQLPVEFGEFSSYVLSLETQPLCQFINDVENAQLFAACLTKNNIFQSGLNSLAEYIE